MTRSHHRVRDVMTTSVVTVDKMTPYKEIAARMAKHKISAVPVLILGRHVAGVVSEADLWTFREQITTTQARFISSRSRRAMTRGRRRQP
jgi:CBS-domain-containing membrane protein